MCSDCGTVVDVIYQSYPPFNLQEDHIIRRSRGIDHSVSLSRHTRTYLKLVRKASEYGLVVDNEVFKEYSLGRSPLVKVFKKPNVDLDRFTSDEPIRLVLDVMMKYPRLASRTDRAKVALAKIALSSLSEEGLDVKKLSRELNISEVHVRRLHKIVISEFGFLDEVRKSLINNVAKGVQYVSS